ncbi:MULTISPECIES: DUF305 domain-containing protein [unclassified Kitasatospora]|uniref:DUF305 domain-containing protein n=1 Tax=unclassified Kitasatospora TaxID=2633591 RepID=UPI00070AE2E3|nr:MULTISPECIES: DUF305 domain-containing protein [unclassified Kitasatospora]KQV04453.1 copper resistance protein [Kitasatospora sp. Root107]KRB61016.1 copper resistance protein [Kitasatospora sp. Root187]
MNTKPNRRLPLAAAALLASALLLTACGSGGGHDAHNAAPATSGTTSTKAYNAADVAFAQGMIPHHRQALEMAELAAGRAASPEVKQLAAAIRAAQDPEIATMSGWLTGWGEQVPPLGAAGAHAGHGGAGTAGMMTEAEMASLKDATGAAFDTAFLKLMVAHHTGALEMAKAEQSKGGYAPAKELAGAVISGQSAEIEQMNKLLG